MTKQDTNKTGASTDQTDGQNTPFMPAAPHPFRKIVKAMAILFSCLSIALLAGFVVFIGYALLTRSQTPQKADAIVVVTGDSGRLEEASALFRAGLGEKLLISGVHPKTSFTYFRKRLNLTQEQLECCVDFDSLALNTVANATQTASWAEKNNFHNLILVTSTYHMPRTMLEMQRAAPHLTFIPHTVKPKDNRPLIARLSDHHRLYFLAKEYGKLLAAYIHATSEHLSRNKS